MPPRDEPPVLLSALPAGAEEASTSLRRTSRVDFGPPFRDRGGVHSTPLTRTSRLAFGPPSRRRGGVHCAPLRRTSRLEFGPPCRGRGGALRPLETDLASRFRPSLPGPRKRSLRPLETNLSCCFRPSLSGPRKRSLRPLETNVSSAFSSQAMPVVGACCLVIFELKPGPCHPTDVDPRSNLPRYRQHRLSLRREVDISIVPLSVAHTIYR